MVVYNQGVVVTPLCEHFRDPIKIGTHIILASEYLWRGDIYTEPVPDVAIYLSALWKNIVTPIEKYGKPPYFEETPLATTPYPVLLIEWADQSAIPLGLLDWLVTNIIKNLDNGNLVEVGCTGGHGRTGTLIACVLGKVENLSARDAVLTLRKRYCKKAVESLQQLCLIAYYLGSPLKTVTNLVPEIPTYARYRQQGT